MNGCSISGECDSYAEFYQESFHKARKKYNCCECSKEIKIGEQYQLAKGVWEGDFSSFRTCCECAEIRFRLVDGGINFGELWSSVREQLFPEMGFACIEKLSPEAKDFIITKWREWKKFPDTAIPLPEEEAQ